MPAHFPIQNDVGKWNLSTSSNVPMDVDQPFTIFEIVADDLDEATHSSVVQTVLLYIGDNPNEQHLSLLLLVIVANSNGKLNPKYEMNAAAVTLLAEHLDLRIELMQHGVLDRSRTYET